ncbi:MAG: hypothetical protein JO363_05825 [Solirubrobacterales bacterium]|nr:hypothetical protein [Solirubrobacterales bacterium]
MGREFSVRVPSATRARRTPGTPEDLPANRELSPSGTDGDVRAKAVYALAEWKGRRARQGQAKLVMAAIQSLRNARAETRKRVHRHASGRT